MGKTASKARRPAREDEATVTPSSGNVFADLGLRDADELLAKADLAHTIQQLIQAQGLSQRAAARHLGVAQPDLSNLYRGRLDGFSIERLCRLLTALGQDVRSVVAGVTNNSSGTPTELSTDTTRGFVMGGGVDVKVLLIHISPEVRYTRWGSAHFVDPIRLISSKQNQAEFLVGITF